MFAIAAVVCFTLDLVFHIAGFNSTSRVLDEQSLMYLGLAFLAAHFLSRRG